MLPLIVLCHPYENSFSHGIAQALADETTGAGSRPIVHDLYAEEVDPVLSGAEIARGFSMDPMIQAFSDEVSRSDALFFVHPDWWSGPPALLKGWIERVLRPGVAYEWEGEEFTEKHHVPLLVGKRLAVFVTTDRAADDSPEPISGFWRDLAAYSGLELARFELFTDVRNSGHRQRRSWLDTVRITAREIVSNG
ncbi:MAG: NAD(P)H-dependent oxidoreductase [Spirochaetota bacterium]